ncbi:MAG: hypothetical protein FJY86_01235 [Candidatus Diapherotrites archaeon]|uniref:Glycosyltransferase 2-like domain-containing protein n=1 Tax=Candidatus Iainarchaeum sp. TaxID=3101447 RepID=A0A8T4C7N0_9ARCH|nr:hypothetical protein [Candidatus Diapherotrites archaeon]
MNTHPPRILVGCPTHELKSDSIEPFLRGIEQLTYTNFDVLLEDNSPTPMYSQRIQEWGNHWMKNHPGQLFEIIHTEKPDDSARQRIVHGRNLLRQRVLSKKYDYFFSLEQDIIPPTDIIETLLSRNQKIVSATYLNRKNIPTGYRIEIMAGYYHNEGEKNKGVFRDYGFNLILPSRLMKVDYTGLGCMLIAREILEKISFRVETNTPHCDDMLFCMDAQKNGYEIYLDTHAWCLHLFNDAFKKTNY